MGEMQVHGTAWLIVIVMLLTAIVQPFGKQKLLQFLELGTLCATWMTLWAGTVFNSYPRCEDGEGGTVGWCDTLSVLVGVIDIAMVFVVIVVVVYLTKQKECDACCGRVKDETVGQHRRESIFREAAGRRSRMESSEVTLCGNPTLDVEAAAGEVGIEMTTRTSGESKATSESSTSDALEVGIETTTRTNERESGRRSTDATATDSDSSDTSTIARGGSDNATSNAVTTFTNPRLTAATADSTQTLSIETDTTTFIALLDVPLPEGWVEHEADNGQLYYEEESSGVTQWDVPTVPSFS